MTDVEFICYCIAGLVIGAFCLGVWVAGGAQNDYRQGYEDGVNLNPPKHMTDLEIGLEMYAHEPIEEVYRRARQKQESRNRVIEAEEAYQRERSRHGRP